MSMEMASVATWTFLVELRMSWVFLLKDRADLCCLQDDV